MKSEWTKRSGAVVGVAAAAVLLGGTAPQEAFAEDGGMPTGQLCASNQVGIGSNGSLRPVRVDICTDPSDIDSVTAGRDVTEHYTVKVTNGGNSSITDPSVYFETMYAATPPAGVTSCQPPVASLPYTYCHAQAWQPGQTLTFRVTVDWPVPVLEGQRAVDQGLMFPFYVQYQPGPGPAAPNEVFTSVTVPFADSVVTPSRAALLNWSVGVAGGAVIAGSGLLLTGRRLGTRRRVVAA